MILLLRIVFDVKQDENDPFSDWSKLVHNEYFLSMGKSMVSDYMIVSSGFINLKKYLIPKTLGESVSKKGIWLGISAYQANSIYSYAKMKNLVSSIQLLPREPIENGAFNERCNILRYSTTRNRLAAGVALFQAPYFYYQE